MTKEPSEGNDAPKKQTRMSDAVWRTVECRGGTRWAREVAVRVTGWGTSEGPVCEDSSPCPLAFGDEDAPPFPSGIGRAPLTRQFYNMIQ